MVVDVCVWIAAFLPGIPIIPLRLNWSNNLSAGVCK